MYITAKKELFNKKTEDGLAILSQDEEKMFILNKTASMLWDLCQSKARVGIDDITSEIKKQYSVRDEDLRDCIDEIMFLIKKNPELFEFHKN